MITQVNKSIIDVNSLKEYLSLGEHSWDEPISYNNSIPETRSEMFEAHKSTHTISLRMNDIYLKDGTYIDNDPCVFYDFKYNSDRYMDYIKPIIKKVLGNYNGIVNRINLVKMDAYSIIERHTDSGTSLEKSRRFHVPIVTNSDVIFHVGEVALNMKEGNCYEIDNQLPHEVINISNMDRIHLIFDYYKEGI